MKLILDDAKVFCLVMAVMLLMCSTAQGQKLHAFLFCKTLDAKIGQSVRVNYINMREQLQFVASALGYEYLEHPVTGLQFKKDNIQRSITGASITKNDIVIVYFSAHGKMLRNNSSKFPLVIALDSDMSAEDVDSIVARQEPKFLLTMIEACSGYATEYIDLTPGESRLLGTQFGGDNTGENINSIQANNIKQLFSLRQNIVLTAGNPGRNTIATSDGSLFTNCFLRAFKETLEVKDSNEGQTKWNSLLERTRQYTYDVSGTIEDTYYPVWKIEYNGVSKVIDNGQDLDRKLVLEIKVTKKNRLKNPYLSTVRILNKSNYSIDKVVYTLDESMENPVLPRDDKSDDFAAYLNVRASFPIRAQVHFSDGKVVEKYGNFLVRSKKKIFTN